MAILDTPFGPIEIKIDGRSVPYVAKEGTVIQKFCPHVLGRYQIEVIFVPDGNKHEISCTFSAGYFYNREMHPGERLECQGFYNSRQYVMYIGVECEADYLPDGSKCSDRYDYDADYLKNGMSYLVLEETKTKHYTFGIAWIDGVDWEHLSDSDTDAHRDTEAWFGADPTIAL